MSSNNFEMVVGNPDAPSGSLAWFGSFNSDFLYQPMETTNASITQNQTWPHVTPQSDEMYDPLAPSSYGIYYPSQTTPLMTPQPLPSQIMHEGPEFNSSELISPSRFCYQPPGLQYLPLQVSQLSPEMLYKEINNILEVHTRYKKMIYDLTQSLRQVLPYSPKQDPASVVSSAIDYIIYLKGRQHEWGLSGPWSMGQYNVMTDMAVGSSGVKIDPDSAQGMPMTYAAPSTNNQAAADFSFGAMNDPSFNLII